MPADKSILLFLPAADDEFDGEKERSTREILLEHVPVNRWLCIALANVFVCFVRYGLLDRAPTYHSEAKGFSFSRSCRAWLDFAALFAVGFLILHYLDGPSRPQLECRCLRKMKEEA